MPETPIKNLKCLKYTLMTINSFGVVIGLFVVLFGLAYPDQNFPGGNRGRDTAIYAGIFIFFSLIGYCGALHQKLFFLVPYVAVIIFGMLYNFLKWAIENEKTCLNAMSYPILFISGLFVLMMALALLLVVRIRKSTTEAALMASGGGSGSSLEKFQFSNGRSGSASFISIPKFLPKK